jgi:hypothetical protein
VARSPGSSGSCIVCSPDPPALRIILEWIDRKYESDTRQSCKASYKRLVASSSYTREKLLDHSNREEKANIECARSTISASQRSSSSPATRICQQDSVPGSRKASTKRHHTYDSTQDPSARGALWCVDHARQNRSAR